MRVIVLSDSPGSTGRLSTILMAAEQGSPIDAIFHLGDGYWDLRDLGVDLPPVYQVAGNCDHFCSDTLNIVSLGGAKFLLTHGHYQHVKDGTDDLLQMAMDEHCAAAEISRWSSSVSMETDIHRRAVADMIISAVQFEAVE